MKISYCLLISAVLLVSACSKNEKPDASSGTPTTTSATTTTQGAAATATTPTAITPATTNDYFDQFIYKDLGYSKFKYLTGSSLIVDNGSNGVKAFVTLFLLPNHNYELRYKESNCDITKGKYLMESCGDPTFAYTFKGAWTVTNGSLELDNFAGGGALNNAGVPAVMLMFRSSINTDGLRDHPIVLTFNELSTGI